MSVETDLIDFSLIEDHKENIQSLPGGRSAKKLAQIYSPVAVNSPPSHTQDLNNSIRQEYENEIANIEESDDPLDVYDRYVKWTLSAYPSAQATPQSQLLPLLERATKTFLSSSHYKDDPRYLKLWLSYIRFFSDAPRETFAYLARHGIGQSLALFYQEFASWLEGAGRWNQASEVYRMGIEREARPVERLLRKFSEFERREQSKPESNDEQPSSPALPAVRPALMAKIDPFGTTVPAVLDPQAASRAAAAATTGTSKKQKLKVFSDDGSEDRPTSGDGPKGWETIGTLAERKKENVIGAVPWKGEKLGVGTKQNAGVPKMIIYKDQSLLHHYQPTVLPTKSSNHPSNEQTLVKPKTGRSECVFVNLEAVYPNPQDPSEEYCFEELRASARGWLQRDWSLERNQHANQGVDGDELRISAKLTDTTISIIPLASTQEEEQNRNSQQKAFVFNDENLPPFASNAATAPTSKEIARRIRKEEKANRTRKIKVREVEVRSETQTIQTNLSSPQCSKPKRKRSAEPTMTLHTKAATDEIYELFNQPLQSVQVDPEESESGDDTEDDDDGYTSAGESTTTGRISAPSSDDEDENEDDGDGNGTTQADLTTTTTKSMGDETGHSENDTVWSEFTTSKDIADETTGITDASEDTEATGTHNGVTETESRIQPEQNQNHAESGECTEGEESLVTPTSPGPATTMNPVTRYVPIPPDGYDAPTRPYRDATQIANSKLPFMTPIVEKTESSLGAATAQKEKDYFTTKTPCPKTYQETPTFPAFDVDSPLTSPLQVVFPENVKPAEIATYPSPSPSPQKPTRETRSLGEDVKENVSKIFSTAAKPRSKPDVLPKGPLIHDAQCNPMDKAIQKIILDQMAPMLISFDGYFEYPTQERNQTSMIKKFCKGLSSSRNRRSGGDQTSGPVLKFEGTDYQYTIDKQLGAGAYAPVYLTVSTDSATVTDEQLPTVMGKGKFGITRREHEAIKMEDPPSAWEFYMIRTAHRRLGVSRAAESIIQAYEMHLFKDECYLIEEYRNQGTLLDLVNSINENNGTIGSSTGMDEVLTMFFTVELLRVVESLHSKGIIHGDLKADNVLIRFITDPNSYDAPAEPSSAYSAKGLDGWSSKGINLIDFGRAIDMRSFKPDVQFIADWQTSATDCAEMRELRPWTYQADYHGLAAIIHTMLYGKYIETVVEKGTMAGVGAGAAGKTYKLKENLKRYWQTDLWGDLFALLLNPTRHVDGEEGSRMPCSRSMRQCREKMERWLEEHSERGTGLRAWIRRVNGLVGSDGRRR